MLALLNKLKTQAVPDWLTDSQQAAFDAVRDALRFPETVNLHRPVGSRAILTLISRTMPLCPIPHFSDEEGHLR